MFYLLSYTDKELTNSFLLASDWLTISVCMIWFDKERFREKSHNMTSKIPLLLQILELTQKTVKLMTFIKKGVGVRII